jgi:hypothetical protein
MTAQHLHPVQLETSPPFFLLLLLLFPLFSFIFQLHYQRKPEGEMRNLFFFLHAPAKRQTF